MLRDIGDAARAASSTAVLSNQIWLRLPDKREVGVRSKSAPMPIRRRPGLSKLDWPCSLLERRSGSRLLGPCNATPRPPTSGMPRLSQQLEAAPAKIGFSNTES